MADLIEFPAYSSNMDHLPEPTDPYRAYARPGTTRHPMLCFAFADGTITSYRFSALHRAEFAPAATPGEPDVFSLYFSLPWTEEPATVRVEGRNLLDLYCFIGQENTGWLRVLPPGQQVKDPAMPVITHITLPPGEF